MFADIHAHIIPAVDDGPSSVEQSTEMLRMAYNEGILTICATPHFHPAHRSPGKEGLVGRLQALQEIALSISDQLQIVLGNEIYYQESVVKDLQSSRCLTLGDSAYVLVEFDTGIDYFSMRQAVTRLLGEGYWPLLAHIERYGCLRDDIDRVAELIKTGAYMQINASSVHVKGARSHSGFVKKLLKRDLIHIIATDCHDIRTRPPLMRASAAIITKKYGEDYARLLCYENPTRILKNKVL